MEPGTPVDLPKSQALRLVSKVPGIVRLCVSPGNFGDSLNVTVLDAQDGWKLILRPDAELVWIRQNR
jgi:hypothetical protein